MVAWPEAAVFVLSSLSASSLFFSRPALGLIEEGSVGAPRGLAGMQPTTASSVGLRIPAVGSPSVPLADGAFCSLRDPLAVQCLSQKTRSAAC